LKDSHAAKAIVLENVELMRWLSGHLAGRRPVETNSHNTLGFSARKSRAIKGVGISDKLAEANHNWVFCWRSEKTVENPRPM
jgi:hypothetical protein